MPSTMTSREDLLAEYVARAAQSMVLNRLRGLLEDEDLDVLERLPHEDSDELVLDHRSEQLFGELWPDDEDPAPEVHAEACYLAARILRTIVYHADHLRVEAEDLFQLADKYRREANEAGVGDDA